ncbi:energy transducer TonB [Ahniella affigens]|nr:energy transducer TonB [Ahniella affigens]
MTQTNSFFASQSVASPMVARLLGLLLAALSAPAMAIEPAPFAASVQIDETGAVKAVSQISSPISPTLQGTLSDQIRQWRFEPAMQAGKPVSWSTTLFGNVPPQGGWPNYFRHGPRPLVSTPPRYPKSSLGMQINTRTLIEAEVGADGRVSSTRVIAVSSYPDHRDMALAMAAAAELAVKAWQFDPEKRDGQAIASRVLVPIGIRPRSYVSPSQWAYHVGTAADFDADRLQMGVLSNVEGPRFLNAKSLAAANARP